MSMNEGNFNDTEAQTALLITLTRQFLRTRHYLKTNLL